MSDRTATAPRQASRRDRLSESADVIERVLLTHLAPVTGLEEEVALILRGCTGDSEDRERG
jgi:hypothetical protein